MSKNISKLSGRIGLKDNLFQKLSERSLNSKNGEGMKELANKYHVGVSTIHGAESFYEFLRSQELIETFSSMDSRNTNMVLICKFFHSFTIFWI